MTVTALTGISAMRLPTLHGAVGRWQPTRAGIISVWQYEDETFEFANGRLVLYGNNGSGKTMALELLFPYLLDANAAPYRLSTAGGNERGGLWSRVTGYDSNPNRVGYLWSEFARTDPGSGLTAHFTCGTRVEARSGGGGRNDWFTTSRRCGHDLHLLDAHRVPLTAADLKAAVGDAGSVWGADAAAYKTEVRTTLYPEFNADGYQAMIDGLLAVRKQSITDELTPSRIDELLRNGLPALDNSELTKVANGFEQLDARRDRIADLEVAVAAAKAFHVRSRDYARVATRALAGEVTKANSRFDQVRREERTAEETLVEVTEKKGAAETRIGEIEDELGELNSRRQAIMESSAYTSIAQLELHRTQAEAGEVNAKAAEKAAEVGAGRAQEAEQATADAADAHEKANSVVVSARDTLTAAARDHGVDADVDPDAETTARRYRDAAHLRDEAVAEVSEALDRNLAAVAARERAVTEVEAVEAALTIRRDEEADAHRKTDAATASWAAAVTAWSADLVELAGGAQTIATAAEQGAIEGVSTSVSTTHRDVAVELNRRDAALAEDGVALTADRATAAGELERLEHSTATVAVSVAPWRTERAAERPGAALWSLLDTAETTAPDDLDGVESALEAAGLLDAWVHPAISGAETGDVVAYETPPVDGPSLADILIVDEQAAQTAGVPPDRVRSILAGIGFAARAGNGPDVEVGADGTFRMGPGRGSAPAGPGRHIGAAARERARLERIAELRDEIASLDDLLAKNTSQRSSLAARLHVAATEAASLPSPEPVRAAHRAAELATSRVGDADGAVITAGEKLARCEQSATGALGVLMRLARTHTLPTTKDALGAVSRALRLILTGLVPDLTNAAIRAGAAQREAERTAGDAQVRNTEAAELAGAARDARRSARELRAAHTELEASTGRDAKQAATAHSQVVTSIGELTAEIGKVRGELRGHDTAAGSARSTLDATQLRRAGAQTSRDTAVGRFQHANEIGVTVDADLDLGTDLTTLTSVITAATAVRDKVRADADASRLSAALQQLEEGRFRAEAALVGRADLSVVVIDEDNPGELAFSVAQARATVDGHVVSPAVLVDRFERDHTAACNELADEEAELFEETLTGSLRAHLASRLRTAQALVDSMNDLLGQIRSASGGVAVSLRWEVAAVDADRDTLKQAKALLLKTTHNADEQTILHAFLAGRIDAVRAADTIDTSWSESLEALFDYRLWHRFQILVRHDRFGDQAVAFTSRKVSLSAGEKSLVLSLPLFAAVASHYMPRDADGDPLSCPRFLLLDEVFPKNDRDNKSQILGLLTELDLDCVLTSDKDMCTYPTIDGIAIAIVAKDGDISCATRLVWDGVKTFAEPADEGGRPGTTPTLL